MNRLAGIIFAAVGLLIAILSIVNIIPGLTATGVIMIIGGGIMIGLSFINGPESEEVERMSTASSLGNIFFSPSEVFQNLRRHPRWLAAVLIMTVLGVTYNNLFMERLGPERIVNFQIDKTLEMPMIAGSEEARKGVEIGRQKALDDAKSPVIRAGQGISSFVGSITIYAILAGVFMLFALAMGGKLNFWQAFSAAVYAAFPVSIIRFALNTLVLYLKDPSDIHPILGQQSLIQDNLGFLVLPSEHPVLYTLISSFSVLLFYWLFLNATGLKNAGERVTGTIAWSATITIFIVILLFGTTMAFLFPSFMS